MTKSINHVSSIPMRERIVTEVGDIFYRNGTYLAGIDRIVNDLNITRATLYRHFRGKEDLVVAYLGRRHDLVRQQLTETVRDKTSSEAIHAIFDSLKAKTQSEAFRGCAFLIAVTENPTSDAIHDVARVHKKFLHEFFDQLLPHQPELSAQLLLLYEGVLASSVLRPEANAAEVAQRLVAHLLSSFSPVSDEAQA